MTFLNNAPTTCYLLITILKGGEEKDETSILPEDPPCCGIGFLGEKR